MTLFRQSTSKFHTRVTCGVLISLSFQLHVHAADIASVPLANETAGSARANVMVIMDDSGSMNDEHMPDNANYSNLCFGASAINTIFYDPTVTYVPPLRADGTLFPAAVFNNAYIDGYPQSGTRKDLSVIANLNTPSTRVGTTSGGAAINSRFYYATYTATSPAVPACGSGYDWTKWAVVTTLPAAQQTNYANWYSFYRQRIYTMRYALGRVMNGIDGSRFRIGYTTITSSSYNNSSGFLRIGEFDLGTQKADFYSKVYAAPTSGTTPLRPALQKIGKYYAGRQMDGSALPSGVPDPLQYSCQRNYAIMTTDGYWNRGNEPSSSWTPTRLVGSTAIGSRDSGTSVALGMRDDGGTGSVNSLADIAMYYYETDLRNPTDTGTACIGSVAGQDVCANNVPAVGADNAAHQHMTTYTIGMGVAGLMTYQADYDTANSGSYFNIRNGSAQWPNPDVSNTANVVTARADDVWHAAVNGRGRYYGASRPADLVTGLTDVLDAITSTSGTGAAAATSSQQPVNGDNFVFLAQYVSQLWEGNIKALTINPGTGAVSTTPLWEAKNTVRAQAVADTDGSPARNIYFRNTSVAVTNLSTFTYANLAASGRGSLFSNLCQTGSYKLSQCATLVAQGAAVQAQANDGNNAVNWLRGRPGKEDIVSNVATDRLFRGRVNTPLGDIVSAAPVYVKRAPFNYADAGYSSFVSGTASRAGTVYVAANDGMLHAFDTTTGAERWAYVPTEVMPELWRLADNNYSTNHRFYVDATPIVGDVYDGTAWRTILVGGLGAGGRAYYALDITDPANPKSLWEISSASESNLGLTFGNPIITKTKLGTWVVAFTSGYNNNTGTGNGNGHLYVRNALTGAAVTTLSTFTSGVVPAGTVAAPSSLGKINAWVPTLTDNTADRIYGGDMLGNLWRFDFDDNVTPAGNEALLLGRAVTAAGVPQPITTKPVLAWIGSPENVPTVTIATGRYLGTSDIPDTTLQSIYTIKDDLTGTGLGVLRTNVNMVQQTMSASTTPPRVASTNPVDWAARAGWYMDFSLSAGERVTVDVLQANGQLAFATNIPAPTACNAGGTSWLYSLDSRNGFIRDAVLGDSMTAGISFVRINGITGVLRTTVRSELPFTALTPIPPSGSGLRRTSWRELVN